MKINLWKLLLLILLAGNGTSTLSNPRIDLEVANTGYINAKVIITNAQLINGSPKENDRAYGFSLILIPFQLNDDWNISKAQDVTVSPLSSNKGYTLLGVTFPPSKNDDLEIYIEKVTKISENREGKAKIALNLDYPFMSQIQKDILELGFSHSEWDIGLSLLKKYEDDEVSKSTSAIKRLSEKNYEITHTDINRLPKKEIWLVFPNAQQKALDIAKLILSLLIGFVTILFQLPIIKDRKLPAVLLVFTASSLVVGLSIYYAHYLSKGFELAVWGAVFIPHVAIAFGGAIYVMIAHRYQASIGVSVSLDNSPIEFCEVILWGKNQNNWVAIETKERLTNGSSIFRLWLKKKYSSYKVTAGSTRSEKVDSSEFLPQKKEKHQVEPLKLVSRTQAVAA